MATPAEAESELRYLATVPKRKQQPAAFSGFKLFPPNVRLESLTNYLPERSSRSESVRPVLRHSPRSIEMKAPSPLRSPGAPPSLITAYAMKGFDPLTRVIRA